MHVHQLGEQRGELRLVNVAVLLEELVESFAELLGVPWCEGRRAPRRYPRGAFVPGRFGLICSQSPPSPPRGPLDEPDEQVHDHDERDDGRGAHGDDDDGGRRVVAGGQAEQPQPRRRRAGRRPRLADRLSGALERREQLRIVPATLA
jgi:hypothetical protein